MQPPRRNLRAPVKLRFALGPSAEPALSSPKDERTILTRPRLEDREGRGCERDIERFRVFCPLARQRDHRIAEVHLVPFQSANFVATRSGQKQQLDDRAVLITAAGRGPNRTQLVIRQDTLAASPFVVLIRGDYNV